MLSWSITAASAVSHISDRPPIRREASTARAAEAAFTSPTVRRTPVVPTSR
jgi:hypothetical protein